MHLPCFHFQYRLTAALLFLLGFSACEGTFLLRSPVLQPIPVSISYSYPTQGETIGGVESQVIQPSDANRPNHHSGRRGIAYRPAPKATTVSPPNVFGSHDPNSGAWVGNIYKLENTTKAIPNFDLISPIASVYTNKLDISTQAQSGLSGITNSTFFGIQYEGILSVKKEADYLLRLNCDDGAKLYIDGMLIIDNDGPKSRAESKSQAVHLVVAEHILRVDYVQLGGNPTVLQLFVKLEGSPETLLSSTL